MKNREGFLEVLGYPSVTVLTGHRGTGKTATGCKILEEAHEKDYKTYLVGLPEEKFTLLPDYIKPMKDVAELPDDSAVFMDEAYTMAYARSFTDEFNQFLSQVMGVSRQKNQIYMFATHTLRKFDVGVILDLDNLIMNLPSRMHAKFERSETRDLTRRSRKAILRKAKETGTDAKEWSAIFTNQREFVAKSRPPTFWTEDISHAFKGVSLQEIRSHSFEQKLSEMSNGQTDSGF